MSAISRLEDADYEGHSLRMLQRIAEALEQKLVVVLTTNVPDDRNRIAFPHFLQLLRRRKGLTMKALARKTEIDRSQLAAMEQGEGIPEPIVLNRLSGFYDIPAQQMLRIAGVIRDQSEGLQEQASKFAAQSESFDTLTHEERKALDVFLAYLRTSV